MIPGMIVNLVDRHQRAAWWRVRAARRYLAQGSEVDPRACLVTAKRDTRFRAPVADSGEIAGQLTGSAGRGQKELTSIEILNQIANMLYLSERLTM